MKGENMGDWNDRSSLRPGEDISSKRYTTLGLKPMLGKPPQTKRRMGIQVADLDHLYSSVGGSVQSGNGSVAFPTNNLAQNGNLILNNNTN